MDLDAKQFQIWKRVLSIAESIRNDESGPSIRKSNLINQLDAIEDTFRKSVDPVEDFQSFVLFELCRAMKSHLKESASD